jgi:siroheme synthase
MATAVDTLVVLMAAGKLQEVCGSLIRAGRPASDPAAVVSSATTPAQRTVVSTLADLPGAAAAAGIEAPATLVVGPVVSLAKDLAWVQEMAAEASISA